MEEKNESFTECSLSKMMRGKDIVLVLKIIAYDYLGWSLRV